MQLIQEIAGIVKANIAGGRLGRLPVPGSPNYTLVNGLFVGSPDNAARYVNAFNTSGTVYAITTYIAQKFGSIPVNVYRTTRNSGAMKEYLYVTKTGQLKEAKKLRKKAMELAEDTQLADLLRRPNPLQGGSTFFENLIGFRLLTGAGTAWANRPTDKEPLELWCLPSQDIVIIVEDQDYLIPAGYQLQNNYIANLRKEDVLYWKYFNPNWDTNGSHLYGHAPLRAARMDVDEDQAAKEAGLSLLQNQGAKGVIFRKGTTELSPELRDLIKQKINDSVNGKRNLGRVEVANTELGYINLGMTAAELDLQAIRNTSKEMLCNIFHFPIPLLSSEAATMNNKETGLKELVSNKIVPEWVSLRDDMNAWLQPMYKGQNLWIEPDFGLLWELQKDMEKLSNAVKNLWQLTPNQVLDYLGFETDDSNPAMNKRYIPSNMVLLDDVAQPMADGSEVDELDKQGLNDYD